MSKHTLDRQSLYAIQDGPARAFMGDAHVMARWTGEAREPEAGEWYLSGAEIGAYQARVKLDKPYGIAKLVEVERMVIYNIRRELPDDY